MSGVGIGLIGTGFMGKAHALAFRAARAVFGDAPEPRLAVLCDTPLDKAQRMADQFGFARATDDWRALVADPAVDAVSITTPNKLHCEIAVAAAEVGKHIWCEKPLALTLEEAERMVAAVRGAGVRSLVGYNYLHNPAFRHAKHLVDTGEIGRLIHIRGFVDEDYQADPAGHWSWRGLKAEAGLGALGDLGCHLVSLACALAGPIDTVLADMQTVYPVRERPDGGSGPVENEDLFSALVRFESGVQGVLCSSRVAWGRKNRLEIEAHGEAGMLCFDQERMNELRLFRAGGPSATQGFATILSGPAHPPYGSFLPAPGHSLGFIDQKTIEAADLLRSIDGRGQAGPDFAAALEIERVIHAIARSAEEARRIRPAAPDERV